MRSPLSSLTQSAIGTAFVVLSVIATVCRAEDGYRLWLRYEPLIEPSPWRSAATQVVFPATTPTLVAAREELTIGLAGLLRLPVQFVAQSSSGPVLLAGTLKSNPEIAALGLADDLKAAGSEGYLLRSTTVSGRRLTVIAANTDIGVLYGTFAFLRHLQTAKAPNQLNTVSAPRIQRRLLNHWDNLNRFVERGYAGSSLWEWFQLPDYRSPRYRDYARANASIGINGTVLTNVNADALVLTPAYISKVAALAEEFRPYGIRVYLTARFSAPVDIGGLKTADPLDAAVVAWWKAKADELYRSIPDFGGFLVKANSEGQPGPQNFGRNHADGANMLADAVAPHGGIVMWRAFVYDQHVPDDRIKQAYHEFKPLDGRFRSNVVLQIKNGPFDFQPREPFHPLFGAMPATALGMEFQITQEYLGGSIHLAYLGTLFEECLDSDTLTAGPGSTVARVLDGSLGRPTVTAIAGVSNIGTDRNWCGHPLAAANWYAFGRLAWDHQLASASIADEWARMTFTNTSDVAATITRMLQGSRETYVNYTMPLGLHGIFAQDHHYGPGPWVDTGRPDWTSVYYHRADKGGLGFDRTASGSNAVAQYAPELAGRLADPSTCPEDLLLWFHHVPWDHRMKSGRSLWDELCLRYQQGVDEVRQLQDSWASLRGKIDEERFAQVQTLLARQEREARGWRDACILYFQQFSQRPAPPGVEQPEHTLEYFKSIHLHYVPGTPSGK